MMKNASQPKFIAYEDAKNTVYITDIRENDFSGYVHSAYQNKHFNFCGVVNMLLILDALMDEMAYPQSYTHDKLFSKKEMNVLVPVDEETIVMNKNGQKATFVVQVHFRQSGSWQGSITWVEKNKTESFKSALQLIKLMNSALVDSEDLDLELNSFKQE